MTREQEHAVRQQARQAANRDDDLGRARTKERAAWWVAELSYKLGIVDARGMIDIHGEVARAFTRDYLKAPHEVWPTQDTTGTSPQRLKENVMATRKGRGGSSGRANPRNDGRITEEQHDDAMRVLRAEYYQGVRGIAQELADRIKDGEITTQDGLKQALQESIDGSYWVIYTHANFQVILCTDHHDEYMEQTGEAPVSDNTINWAALAYYAMMRDVQDQMSAEGVEINEDLEEARRRPRRGPRLPGRRR